MRGECKFSPMNNPTYDQAAIVQHDEFQFRQSNRLNIIDGVEVVAASLVNLEFFQFAEFAKHFADDVLLCEVDGTIGQVEQANILAVILHNLDCFICPLRRFFDRDRVVFVTEILCVLIQSEPVCAFQMQWQVFHRCSILSDDFVPPCDKK